MIISTEAITLRARKYGESGKIVSLFSRDEGLISVIAKGARQTKSKFGSALDPLSYCQVQYYKKPERNLHLLSKAEIFKPMRRIYSSEKHLSAGLLILESVAQTQSENEKNEHLFLSLAKTIVELNMLNENPFSLFVSFQLHLASELGFGLNFEDIGEGIDSGPDIELRFSLESGALLNNKFPVYNHSFRIKSDALIFLKNISGSPIEKVSEFCAEDVYKPNLCDFFVKYFSYHLDKKFSYRSLGIMNI